MRALGKTKQVCLRQKNSGFLNMPKLIVVAKKVRQIFWNSCNCANIIMSLNYLCLAFK